MLEKDNSYQSIREAIVKEQLCRMLPEADNIDLIFCAYSLCKMIDGFKLNPKFGGGKC